MNKDMVYYELADACKDNCCPICALIKKRTLQAMDAFFSKQASVI